MIEELPPYLYCDVDGCFDRHYLTLNRDVQGRWSIGYIAYMPERGIGELCENSFTSINEASRWLSDALKKRS